MNTDFLALILISGLVGASSGYLGSYMVLKRMALTGDALSHIALPGIAVALGFSLNPMLGAFVALTLAVLGIWYLSERTKVYSEALVGVFFTASLAVGILITPEPEIFEALFGDIDKVGRMDLLAVLLGSLIVFAVLSFIRKSLTLDIVSNDLAKAQGINTSRINLIYLLLVGLIVSLGVKFLGTLLTGALVIIPAAAAKNVSLNMKNYNLLSTVLGSISAILGLIIAKSQQLPTGPVVVLVAIAFYILSLLYKKPKKV